MHQLLTALGEQRQETSLGTTPKETQHLWLPKPGQEAYRHDDTTHPSIIPSLVVFFQLYKGRKYARLLIERKRKRRFPSRFGLFQRHVARSNTLPLLPGRRGAAGSYPATRNRGRTHSFPFSDPKGAGRSEEGGWRTGGGFPSTLRTMGDSRQPRAKGPGWPSG